MSEEEIKKLGEQAWNQYWGMTTMVGLARKFPDSIVPFFKQFFEGGFLEGFRTKEETSKGAEQFLKECEE